MASNSQGCDKTSGDAWTLWGTCPGHSPQGWGLSRDLRATPDSSCLGFQELEFFTKIVYQEAAERWARQEFIILPEMRVYPVTGLYDHWCSEQFVFFTERKTISAWRIYFFVKYFQSFNYFFFSYCIPSFQQRETGVKVSAASVSWKSFPCSERLAATEGLLFQFASLIWLSCYIYKRGICWYLIWFALKPQQKYKYVLLIFFCSIDGHFAHGLHISGVFVRSREGCEKLIKVYWIKKMQMILWAAR